MELRKLFERRLWRQADLAELTDTTQSYISRIALGKARCGVLLALKIERATTGVVTAEELPLTDEGRELLRIVRSGKGRAA